MGAHATKSVSEGGRYRTRDGRSVDIKYKDGQYYVGYIKAGKNAKKWRWFKDGRSYGQELSDDITG